MILEPRGMLQECSGWSKAVKHEMQLLFWLIFVPHLSWLYWKDSLLFLALMSHQSSVMDYIFIMSAFIINLSLISSGPDCLENGCDHFSCRQTKCQKKKKRVCLNYRRALPRALLCWLLVNKMVWRGHLVSKIIDNSFNSQLIWKRAFHQMWILQFKCDIWNKNTSFSFEVSCFQY